MTVIKNIQEIIPLTIQGEGFHAGRSCSFIRLFGCPVGCWFCDTGYAPRDRENLNTLPRLSIDYESLRDKLQSRYVVISGGEPLFHQDFEELLERLLGDNFEVAVETSGTKAFPFEKFPQVWVTFSPKLHATDYHKGQLSPTFWTHSKEIKVVISEPSDLYFYEDLLDQASASEIAVFLQPEWSKREFLTSFILTTLQKKPAWKFSIQQHKYLNLS